MKRGLSFSRVLRGSFWLTVGTLVANLFGFVYWLLVSPVVSPNAVGRAAVIIAVESLLLSTLSLGIPNGVIRFLGRDHGKGDTIALGKHFYSNLLLMIVVDAVAGLTLLTLGLNGYAVGPLDPESLLFTSLLILFGTNGWTLLLISFFNSTLKTEYITLAGIVTGLSRICIGVPLVYLGLGFFGLMMGYVISAVANSITLLVLAVRELRRLAVKHVLSAAAVGETVEAGLASWFPSLLALAGQWIGVLGLGSLVGSYETGNYFIAYAITAGLLAFPISIVQLMFPVVSGMEDGRKRAMGRAVRVASSSMYPIAFTLIAYPSLLPSLLGKPYLPAAELIRILAAGFLLAPLVNGYTYYTYAIGDYKQVTLIGVAGNIPRIVLYPIMIGQLADRGAAASFTLGFLSSITAVLLLSRKTGYRLNLWENLKTLTVPLFPFLPTMLLNVAPIAGISLLITFSYIAYARFQIITKKNTWKTFH